MLHGKQTYVQLMMIVFANVFVYVGFLHVHDFCLVINAHVNLVVPLMHYLGSNYLVVRVLPYHQRLDLTQAVIRVYYLLLLMEDKIHRKPLPVFGAVSNL